MIFYCIAVALFLLCLPFVVLALALYWCHYPNGRRPRHK